MKSRMALFKKKKSRSRLSLPPVWPEKIAKCLYKLPKNDFTRKMKDINTSKKLPMDVGDFGKLAVAKGFKKLLKFQ